MIIVTKEEALSISDLIQKMEEFKAEYGDLPVAIAYQDYYEQNYVYVDRLCYYEKGQCRLPADSLVID